MWGQQSQKSSQQTTGRACKQVRKLLICRHTWQLIYQSLFASFDCYRIIFNPPGKIPGIVLLSIRCIICQYYITVQPLIILRLNCNQSCQTGYMLCNKTTAATVRIIHKSLVFYSSQLWNLSKIITRKSKQSKWKVKGHPISQWHRTPCDQKKKRKEKKWKKW